VKWARAAATDGKYIREIGIDAAARLILLCERAAIAGEQLREGRWPGGAQNRFSCLDRTAGSGLVPRLHMLHHMIA